MARSGTVRVVVYLDAASASALSVLAESERRSVSGAAALLLENALVGTVRDVAVNVRVAEVLTERERQEPVVSGEAAGTYSAGRAIDHPPVGPVPISRSVSASAKGSCPMVVPRGVKCKACGKLHQA